MRRDRHAEESNRSLLPVVGVVLVVVAAAVAVAVAVAAASGDVDGLTAGTNNPVASPTDADDVRTDPSPRCTGDETVPEFEGLDGALPSNGEGFELAASADAVAPGERIAVSLTNVAEERQYTGTRAKYALQRRASGNWETVTLFREPSAGFNATAVPHDPGGGFDWSFRASQRGFSGGKYVVCDRLDPGDYRFVYASERPLAVEFEVGDGS